MIAILDDSLKYMFRKFDPINRMIVARDTGLLNPYFAVEKSQLICLYDFATCGATENDTPETYPDTILQQQEWEKPITSDRGEPKLSMYMKSEDIVDYNNMWIPAEYTVPKSRRGKTKIA